MPPTHIAILGGGITGLSAAFHLSKRFPSARLTLLEQTDRLGGWIRSKRVEVEVPGGDVGSALLELGPRTLRPQSKALLELVNLLGLAPQLITTPEDTPASKNRYIYFPDVSKLTIIPSSVLGHLTSRLSFVTLPSVLREPFRKANRPTDADDESFDALMSRRFGTEFARILGSALVHGIYAADSRRLSVRAAFAPIWNAETRGDGSIVKGLYRSRLSGAATSTGYDIGDLEKGMKNIAVYSFQGGLETLVNTLRRKLEMTPNVDIHCGVPVSQLDHVDGKFRLSTRSGPLHPSHLVTTIPLHSLQPLVSDAKLPHLASKHTSSVTIASFVFAASPTLIHPEGFGYLIPRPKGDYESSENPEGILGVVFDSCSAGAQDRPRGSLTKMTMMLGGPYRRFSAEISDMGKILFNRMQRHLGRRLPNPVYFGVWHNNDCIPVPGPGHLRRMEELKRALQEDPWRGKLEVIGAGVDGVSVGDCVEQGRRVGRDWG